MMISKLLKNLLFFLFAAIIGINSAAASAAERPIITLSFGSPYSSPIINPCNPAYIIKIFENGHVEYQGVNRIKVLGKHEYQIDMVTLKALIKKFQDANFMAAALDERVWLPDSVRSYTPFARLGIRFRQGDQQATKFNDYGHSQLYKLKSEIIRATKAERWGVNELLFCHNGIK